MRGFITQVEGARFCIGLLETFTMSRFSKNDVRSQLSSFRQIGVPALSPAEIECRRELLAEFSKFLVGFREGKQSSCRGAWSSKEYSEVRLKLRQIPNTKAFEM